ncbi:hypothetical protein DUI70_2210 [Streptomyces albus]|nr:hypothetical protein DUI70_2210 [Streptomyces albus]
MRERVREVSFLLDRETFHRVWAWLGDHRAMSTAITALRRGHPYAFALNTRTTQWTWTAYPVSELPVLPHPPGHPRHEHPGAPSPAPSTVTT